MPNVLFPGMILKRYLNNLFKLKKSISVKNAGVPGGTPQLNIREGGGGLARRSESRPPKYLSKNSNIRKMLKSYPLNILKVQSESSSKD